MAGGNIHPQLLLKNNLLFFLLIVYCLETPKFFFVGSYN